MTTPKCPLCGTPLKAIRGYDAHGITTDWVAGCYNCAYNNIKPIPVVCNPCINEGFAVNWEPRKEGE